MGGCFGLDCLKFEEDNLDITEQKSTTRIKPTSSLDFYGYISIFGEQAGKQAGKQPSTKEYNGKIEEIDRKQ